MYVNIYVQSGLVGLALIFLFYASAVIFRRWMSLEYRGLALTFITVWILTGLGESANLAASSNISYFLGVGIAYCRFCPRRIIYQSFMPVGGNPYGGVR